MSLLGLCSSNSILSTSYVLQSSSGIYRFNHIVIAFMRHFINFCSHLNWLDYFRFSSICRSISALNSFASECFSLSILNFHFPFAILHAVLCCQRLFGIWRHLGVATLEEKRIQSVSSDDVSWIFIDMAFHLNAMRWQHRILFSAHPCRIPSATLATGNQTNTTTSSPSHIS